MGSCSSVLVRSSDKACVGGREVVASRAVVNTTLAASAGATGSLIFGHFARGRSKGQRIYVGLENTLNGVLAGLVGIAAG